MRIVLVSDLHADFLPTDKRRVLVLSALAESIRGARPDVVVVAGDVANHYSRVAPALRHLAVGRQANLFVEGNHDIWRSDREIAAGRTSYGAQTLLRAEVAKAGFHRLPGHPVKVGGWGFVGSIGWSDDSLAAPGLVLPPGGYAAKEYGGVVWNDRDRALWVTATGRRRTDAEVTAESLAALERDLRAIGCAEDGNGPPTIAITHFLPVRELVAYKGVPSWDYFAAFMGSAKFGALIERYPTVRAGFAGHTHVPRRATVSGRLFAVAPLGYYGSSEYPRDFGTRIAFFETQGTTIREIGAPR